MRIAKRIAPLILVFSIACASLESNAYKTLGTTAVAVDTAMKTYAQLVVAGKVLQSTQDQVRKAYGDYQTAMSAAQVAVLTWKAAGGSKASFPSAAVSHAVTAGATVQAKAVTP